MSRSNNHLAPSVKKAVNARITPPPAARAAPPTSSPGLGRQPTSPPGPPVHGGPWPGGGVAAGAASASSLAATAAGAARRGLGARRTVELLELGGRAEQLAGWAWRGLAATGVGPGTVPTSTSFQSPAQRSRSVEVAHSACGARPPSLP